MWPRIALFVMLAIFIPVMAQGFDPHSPEAHEEMCRLLHFHGPVCQEAIEGYKDGAWLHEMFLIDLENLGLEIAIQRLGERRKKLLEKYGMLSGIPAEGPYWLIIISSACGGHQLHGA
jgi:hypothetical protein